MRTLVLGLGNEFAADDAVGVLAARAVAGRLGDEVDVTWSAASGMALIEVLAGYDRAIVVDAVRTGRNPPGAIVEMGLADVGAVIAPSTHQAGLPELSAVAARLGLSFPAETRVLAVEVIDPFTFGGPVSAAVAAAMPEVVHRIAELVDRWSRSRVGEGAVCTTTTR